MNRRSFFGFMAAGIAAITGIPDVSKFMPAAPVTRRLKATWSLELAQDLRAYHGLDAEAELAAILEQEIAREIGITTRGTITKSPVIYDPVNFSASYPLTFCADGQHTHTDLWGMTL